MDSSRRQYCSQSEFTELGPPGGVFPVFDGTLPELVRSVQNVCFHELYAREQQLVHADRSLPCTEADSAVRYARELGRRLAARDSAPCTAPRPKSSCIIGTCRDYAVLLCGLLRRKGRCARVRCGFAFYFDPTIDFGDDHWIVELWSDLERRWHIVDAEVDHTLRQHAHISEDPLDIPRDRFLTAGEAWRACRAGHRSPEQFGVHAIGLTGLWFVGSDVVRDLAALCKVELLPFDYWGIALELEQSRAVTEEQGALLDEIAEITSDAQVSYAAARALYDRHSCVRPIETIRSWPKGVESHYRVSTAGTSPTCTLIVEPVHQLSTEATA